MAFRSKKGYRIKRSRSGPRPIWLLGAVGIAAAAFALAFVWQERENARAAVPVFEGATLGVSAEAVPASAPAAPAAGVAASPAPPATPAPTPSATPIVVGGAGEAASPRASPVEVGGGKSYAVPYQVAAGDPVDAAYFDDALFVGDSITTGITLYGAMANAAVVAATGINPNTILQKPVIRDEAGELHTVLEAMAGHTPGKIYLLLGANGIAWIDQETFIARYEELIDAVRAQHPQALLYVQSIFPVTQSKSLGENGIYANAKIDSYNRALMELCEEKGLPYLNVAEAFKGADGALPAGASRDGIHLGPAYYEKWFDYLRTHTADAPAPAANEEKEKEPKKDDEEK